MAKEYKTIAAAQKAGSMYYTGKDGKKKLAVTKEQLDAWKKRNKGKFTGSALTAWANAKGKDIGGSKRDSSPRPKLRPKTGEKTGTPTKKKPVPVEDITLTAAAAIDGKSGVQGYITKLEKQLTELRASAEAKRKRDVVPRTEEAKIRSIEGSIKRIKEKQGMSKGGMAKKKSGYSKGGVVDMRKTGLFR